MRIAPRNRYNPRVIQHNGVGPDQGRPPREESNMASIPRQQCLDRLSEQLARGRPIIGGGAGTGLSAKCAEAGGIDLIIIYNSGRFRMAGRGSLAGMMPYGDANAIVMDMAREVLPRRQNDAGARRRLRHRSVSRHEVLSRARSKRPASPACRTFRPSASSTARSVKGLEETDMGYGLEVDMIRLAREMDLLTCPYVFNRDEAEAMTRAGADVLIPHMGLTTKGTIGAKTAMTLDEAVARVQAMADAAKAINPDILVLCHGGPIAEPDDAAYVLAHTRGVVGFFGASSIERLPTEVAITECARRFKAMRMAE